MRNMIIEILKVETIDRFNRKFSHNIFCLQCDVCKKEWKKRGCKSRLEFADHYCSRECKIKANKKGGITTKKRNKTCIEKYGTELPSSLLEFRLKQQNTMIKNHGVAFPMQLQSVKEAMMNGSMAKYGTPFVAQSTIGQQKMQNTCLERHGVKSPMQSDAIKIKMQNTCLERYGEINVSKSQYFANLPFNNKRHKSGYVKFREKQIWFRSSYEERFIKWCDKKIEIIDLFCNIPIKYFFENKIHTYFIDFGVVYNDNRKILYEVKSKYASNFLKNQAKFKSAKESFISLQYDDFQVITEIELSELESEI